MRDDIDLGANITAVIRSISPDEYDCFPNHFLIGRFAGRTLEEMVELCLACGLSAKDVMGHVMDAIHNEARKASKYPAQLHDDVIVKGDVTKELADVELCVEATRHISGVRRQAVENEIQRKFAQLETQVAANEMVLIDGLMYRRVR